MSSLPLHPEMSLPAWITLVVVAGAVVAWLACKRPAAMSTARWRLVVLCTAMSVLLVLIVLGNPVRPDATDADEPPGLTILVDASASMKLEDTAGDRSRWEEARGLINRVRDELGGMCHIRTVAFDSRVRIVDRDELNVLTPDGATDLAEAVSVASRGSWPNGHVILLISDGVATTGVGAPGILDAARRARTSRSPVCTMTIGGATPVPDLSIEVLNPMQTARAGQPVPINVGVHGRGVPAHVAELSVWHDGHLAARREIDPSENAKVRIEVEAAHAGPHLFEVRLAPHPDEPVTMNNHAVSLVSVIDEPLRVLVLEGQPYWDTTFLLDSLARDKRIELDCVTRLAPNRFAWRTITSASTSDWRVLSHVDAILKTSQVLDAYQIILLGREVEPFLSASVLAGLETWMAAGGGALICHRSVHTEGVGGLLASLLRIDGEGGREVLIRATRTESARGWQWFAADSEESAPDPLSLLPAVTSSGLGALRTPTSLVLIAEADATDEPRPIMTWLPMGRGGALLIDGAGMWRWAFLPAAHRDHEDVYATLWHSIVRWLASRDALPVGQPLALWPGRPVFDVTEAASATLLAGPRTLHAEDLRIELRNAAGDVLSLHEPLPVESADTTYTVDFGRLPIGAYEACVTPPADGGLARTRFMVAEEGRELRRTAPDPGLMAEIAERSGGRVIEAGAITVIGQVLEQQQADARASRAVTHMAWDRWWLFGAIVLAMATAWSLRRTGGMV